MRSPIPSLVTLLLVLAVGGCGGGPQATSEAPSGETGGPGTEGHPPMGDLVTPAQDPGVEWQAPKRWVEELASGMRLATYAIPAPQAGGEAAKCAVYYFGPGQGGGTEANIERWIAEFESPQKPARRSFDVKGLKVSQVEVTGTYLAHAGGPESAEGATGWTVLGAIVEGPSGSVFFKLAGPAATVAPARKEFEDMVRSVRPS